jgi:two-component system phosphate regulon sensor histidine kinase PhoR
MKNTDRLSWIVEDLLALSRTEEIEEKGGIRVETALIEGVLADVSAGFADVAKRKDIELAIQCETGLLANVNPQLLCRAVSNLVDNALRFSETGSTVTVVAEKTAHDVVIRVIDHGPGIARDQVYRIFERFYKTGSPTAGEKVGTGLGLSVAKHIVQAHDGKIEVETKPGKGSTFTIHLPAV